MSEYFNKLDPSVEAPLLWGDISAVRRRPATASTGLRPTKPAVTKQWEALAKEMSNDPALRRRVIADLSSSSSLAPDPPVNDPDARAAAEIDRLAVQLRKSDSTLSDAQAFVKALDERSDLYQPASRHWAAAAARELAAGARDDAVTITKARELETPAERAIERAAAVLREADPSLSEAQAFVKALEADPKLYADYLGAAS